MSWRRFASVVGAASVTGYAAFCAEPPYNEKIRGTYENKIRQHAPPEKVFETFATIKKGKEFFMTQKDFFKSLTPYNFSPNVDQEEFFQEHASLVFKMIDVNKDGVLDFSEYFFFVVMLNISNSAAREMFNQRAVDGKLSKAQYAEMAIEARQQSAAGQQLSQAGVLPDARSTAAHIDEFNEATENIIQYLFRDREFITWEDYLEFKNLFVEELLFFEFHMFDIGEDNCIDIKDFGKSMISYFPTAKVDTYLKRLNSLEFEGRVNYAQFVAFQKLLHNAGLLERSLLELQERKGRPTALQDLIKIIHNLCNEIPFTLRHGLTVSQQQIELFFKLLDIDDSGFLEPEEFMDLIVTRKTFGTSQSNKPQINAFQELAKKLANEVMKSLGFVPYFRPKEETTKKEFEDQVEHD